MIQTECHRRWRRSDHQRLGPLAKLQLKIEIGVKLGCTLLHHTLQRVQLLRWLIIADFIAGIGLQPVNERSLADEKVPA